MAIEVPSGDGGEPSQRPAGRRVQNEGPIAGAPRKHHHTASPRLNGEAMAATGEWHIVMDAAGLIED